jgi:hypothetical protein
VRPRVHRSSPTLVARGVLLVAIFGWSCKGADLASRAECERLRDRYIDLELSSRAAARVLTPEARAALRGQLALEVLSGSQRQHIDRPCETGVTQAEYKCAVAALTLDAWNRCFE